MRCEDTSAKLADYLGAGTAGTLTDAERQALESHALACPACREELEGASEMWQRLGRVRVADADSRGMRARFEAMMADAATSTSDDAGREQDASNANSTPTHGRAVPIQGRAEPVLQSATSPSMRTKTSRWLRRHRTVRPLLQACAAAILVVVGIQVGRQMAPPPVTAPDVTALRDEVRDLRQMMTLSLLQQQSVTERLKGVSWSSQLNQPGTEVVSALIDTLMHDGNVNVRLASIDALKRFAERDVVRNAAVLALDTQTSPLVQMALIDFVVETQDRKALDTLRRLSNDDKTNEAVRMRASWGIDHLEAA